LDLPRLMTGHAKCHHRFRFVFMLVLLIVNVGIQIFFMYYIWMFVVRPAVHHLQLYYAVYHQTMFSHDEMFNATAFGDYEHTRELCKSSLGFPGFLFPVLMLWTLRMLQEWRETERCVRYLWRLERVDDVRSMIRENTKTGTYDQFGKYIVVGITQKIFFALMICIALPKAMINAAVLFFGCRWLTATTSCTDLILNSLALEFVVNIDELLFRAICPVAMTKLMAAMRLQNKTGADVEDSSKDLDKTHFDLTADIVRSLRYMFYCLVWVCLYMFVLESVIPHYPGDIDYACQPYWKIVRHLTCGPENIFDKVEHCFPYGPPLLDG
jgi:hypothetical protein